MRTGACQLLYATIAQQTCLVASINWSKQQTQKEATLYAHGASAAETKNVAALARDHSASHAFTTTDL